jgi:hypothetical protein
MYYSSIWCKNLQMKIRPGLDAASKFRKWLFDLPLAVSLTEKLSFRNRFSKLKMMWSCFMTSFSVSVFTFSCQESTQEWNIDYNPHCRYERLQNKEETLEHIGSLHRSVCCDQCRCLTDPGSILDQSNTICSGWGCVQTLFSVLPFPLPVGSLPCFLSRFHRPISYSSSFYLSSVRNRNGRQEPRTGVIVTADVRWQQVVVMFMWRERELIWIT